MEIQCNQYQYNQYQYNTRIMLEKQKERKNDVYIYMNIFYKSDSNKMLQYLKKKYSDLSQKKTLHLAEITGLYDKKLYEIQLLIQQTSIKYDLKLQRKKQQKLNELEKRKTVIITQTDEKNSNISSPEFSENFSPTLQNIDLKSKNKCIQDLEECESPNFKKIQLENLEQQMRQMAQSFSQFQNILNTVSSIKIQECEKQDEKQEDDITITDDQLLQEQKNQNLEVIYNEFGGKQQNIDNST